MTKDEWAGIADRLKRFYNFVELDCDGYRLSLHLGQISTFRNAIVINVNGRFKWRWVIKDCEERRRFMRPATRRIHPKNAYKGIGRRTLKRMCIDPDATYIFYYPYWTNFNALRLHLVKNNANIVLAREPAREREAAL